MYYNKSKNEYLEKSCELILIVKYSKGVKVAGEIQLDLADYLNKQKFETK